MPRRKKTKKPPSLSTDQASAVDAKQEEEASGEEGAPSSLADRAPTTTARQPVKTSAATVSAGAGAGVHVGSGSSGSSSASSVAASAITVGSGVAMLDMSQFGSNLRDWLKTAEGYRGILMAMTQVIRDLSNQRYGGRRLETLCRACQMVRDHMTAPDVQRIAPDEVLKVFLNNSTEWSDATTIHHASTNVRLSRAVITQYRDYSQSRIRSGQFDLEEAQYLAQLVSALHQEPNAKETKLMIQATRLLTEERQVLNLASLGLDHCYDYIGTRLDLWLQTQESHQLLQLYRQALKSYRAGISLFSPGPDDFSEFEKAVNYAGAEGVATVDIIAYGLRGSLWTQKASGTVAMFTTAASFNVVLMCQILNAFATGLLVPPARFSSKDEVAAHALVVTLVKPGSTDWSQHAQAIFHSTTSLAGRLEVLAGFIARRESETAVDVALSASSGGDDSD